MLDTLVDGQDRDVAAAGGASVVEQSLERPEDLGIAVIFKTSYDKANRTSLDSYRGPGINKGLEIIRKVKEETGLPALSDVHNKDEVEQVTGILDVIQIPAFLCRQTDLLIAAAQTGIPINIK